MPLDIGESEVCPVTAALQDQKVSLDCLVQEDPLDQMATEAPLARLVFKESLDLKDLLDPMENVDLQAHQVTKEKLEREDQPDQMV